jgi:hypothetical protein
MQKSVRRDKECHYILIKGTIQQEDVIILSIYALNIKDSTFIKQTFLRLKEQMGTDTIFVGYLNTALSSIENLDIKSTKLSYN